MKCIAFLIVLGLFAVPAFAAEATKGTKSYQIRSETPAGDQAVTAEQPKAEDAAKIAPAAGDMQEAEKPADQTKSWREDMKLPRKN